MVELQFLSRILLNKTLSVAQQNGISVDHFMEYKPEADFIFRHYEKYGVVPDVETFLDRFDDINILDVLESDRYLVETLQEQKLYKDMVPVIRRIEELARTDSQAAFKYMREQAEVITQYAHTYRAGYSLIRNSMDRKTEFEKRMNQKGLLGIPTGIVQFDDISHGWMPEDFVLIEGRSNEGKTWVLMFFLVQAWRAGKKVLFYSGEMGTDLVGWRFDTLNAQFANMALMSGRKNLGADKGPDDYYAYLDDLRKKGGDFIVIRPRDIGGRLDIPKLHSLIEQHKPDLVGIDQVSIMEDYRSQRSGRTESLTHLAEDLYATTEKYQIPILSPVQANRDSLDADNDEAPDLQHIFGSDALGQNATRVAAIRYMKPVMKLVLRKNRYGLKNQEVMLMWDMDKGVIKPFMSVNADGGKVEGKLVENFEKDKYF